jgi:hypothetical protein
MSLGNSATFPQYLSLNSCVRAHEVGIEHEIAARISEIQAAAQLGRLCPLSKLPLSFPPQFVFVLFFLFPRGRVTRFFLRIVFLSSLRKAVTFQTIRFFFIDCAAVLGTFFTSGCGARSVTVQWAGG